MGNEVILVDNNDKMVGTCEKLEAHEKGLLHRAFSIFLFNSKRELLLQRRALEKYHSGGLWTNTVCSHPSIGEDIVLSAKSRLIDEMNIVANVKEIFSFLYKSNYDNGLCEHEFDHVFIGFYEGEVKPNPEEVMDYKWIKLDELIEDITKNPNNYTSWFKVIMTNEKHVLKLKEELEKLL